MTRTLINPVVLRLMEGHTRIDSELPPWARRSNPIVKRELGIYWKSLPLEIGLWARLIALQSGVVLIAVPFPIIYSFIMPVVTVSILLMPVVFFTYGQTLLRILILTSGSMLDERYNNTLPLMLVTPMTLDRLLFSKLAAAVWRQIDNLGLIMLAHVLLSLPLVVLQSAGAYPQTEGAWMTALAIILSLITGLLRLFIEPVMVGAIGLLMGTCTSPRAIAVIAGSALTATYFGLINLTRLISLPPALQLTLGIGLPLLLPLLITAGALVATARVLRQD